MSEDYVELFYTEDTSYFAKRVELAALVVGIHMQFALEDMKSH